MGLKHLVTLLLCKCLNSICAFYGLTNSITILQVIQFSLSLSETDGKVEESIHTLERTKEELLKQRELLEQKLQDGSLLDPTEERRCC